MDSATFKYVDSASAIQSRSIQVLSVRGFEEPDFVAFVPPIQNNFVDGSLETQFKGFRRVITFDCGVLSSATDRGFVLNFLTANVRSITYQAAAIGIEEIIVSHDSGFEYNNSWVNDFIGGKQFILYVVENAIRTTWTNYTPAAETEIMYVKLKVKVVGTQASPETFQTNSGKLAVMENGSVFPAISLLTWVATVVANGAKYQDAGINQVGNISNIGTDLSFQLAVSDAGTASGDGFYYADIIFLLQAR